MNMIAQLGGYGELRRQARIARELGSEFVAEILEASHRQLDNAPRTAMLFANWEGDPSAAALAMRFNGALHALARRGKSPALTALYQGAHDDFDGAIATALAGEDDFIWSWMQSPPQTNEVGRSAAIGAALMVLRREFGYAFELLEVGSSCGLNLNLAHYSYDLGGVAAGNPASKVRIKPQWRGVLPAYAPIEVVSARGVDLSPLDASDPATRDRLLSFIWADQRERAQRLEHALDFARDHPPQIDKAHALTWLIERLEAPQAAGVCRVIFHSMVFQYLTEGDRQQGRAAMLAAGERATAERPLARIGFEWTPDRSEVQLSLSYWPGEEMRILATCHPYGDWVDWIGAN